MSTLLIAQTSKKSVSRILEFVSLLKKYTLLTVKPKIRLGYSRVRIILSFSLVAQLRNPISPFPFSVVGGFLFMLTKSTVDFFFFFDQASLSYINLVTY